MHTTPIHTCIIEGLKKILDRLTRMAIWRVQESLDGVLWGCWVRPSPSTLGDPEGQGRERKTRQGTIR
jgi:hypothetical protein